MTAKEEITAAVDDLQRGVRLLIEMPGRVTINTDEYRVFYDKVQSFTGRYNLTETEEWREVDRWLIKKPKEYLTLEEAGRLKLALEKLRMRAIVNLENMLTAEEKAEANKRIDEAFKELYKLGCEQIQLLKDQVAILKNGNKSARVWNWIMFGVALLGIIAAFIR